MHLMAWAHSAIADLGDLNAPCEMLACGPVVVPAHRLVKGPRPAVPGEHPQGHNLQAPGGERCDSGVVQCAARSLPCPWP